MASAVWHSFFDLLFLTASLNGFAALSNSGLELLDDLSSLNGLNGLNGLPGLFADEGRGSTFSTS